MANLIESDVAATERLNAIWASEQKKRTFTQESAAADMALRSRAKIDQGYLNHYLSGRRKLTVQVILMFSSFLKVAPEEINPDFDYGYRSTGTASGELSAMTGVGSIAALISSATPRTRKALEEIQAAANAGKISDDDMELLNTIAKRMAK